MTRKELRELAREHMGELVLATQQYSEFEKALLQHLEVNNDSGLGAQGVARALQLQAENTESAPARIATPADILSQLQFAGCLFRKNGVIVSVNTDFVRQCLFCFHFEPKPGDNLFEHLRETSSVVRSLVGDAMPGTPVTALDHRTIRGEAMTFELLVSALSGTEEPEFLLQSRDITLQIQTEQELSRRDNLFKTLIQHSSDVIVTTNENGEISYVSPSIKSMIDVAPDHIIGQRIDALIVENERGEFRSFLSSIGQHDHETMSSEFRFLHASGKHVFVELFGSRFEDNNTIGFVFNARDITDRVITFRALQRSENRYRDLISNAVDVIYTLNQDGEFVTLNQAFTDVTGFAVHSWIGRELLSLIHPEDKNKASRGLKLLNEGQRVPALHLRIECKSGVYVHMEFRSAPLSGEDYTKGCVGIARDITEQLKSQHDLQKALAKEREMSQLRDRFVSTVTHEFRTPLAGILSVSELLDRYKDRLDDKKRDELFADIRLRVVEITELIENFVFQTSVHSLMENFAPIPIDAVPLVRDAVQAIVEQRHTETLQVHFEAHSDSIVVESEPKVLQHIVKHIVTDCVKYRNGTAQVHIAIERVGEKGVIITISDRGIGIPEREQNEIFTPFYRASNASHIPGTGMGLAIVSDFIDLHNGKISVSTNEHGGTTFVIVIGT